MKDKHIKIERDSLLLKLIKFEISKHLQINKAYTKKFLLLKFVFYCFLAIVFYTGLFVIHDVFMFVVSYILYGFVTLLLAFNFSHDLSHNTVFKSRKINNFFYIITFAIVGAHAEAWKKRHINSHHYAPNVEGYDSDLKITKLIRVIPNSDYYWFHRFQHIYAPIAYTTYSLFWIFVKDIVLLFSKDSHQVKTKVAYHISFWIQKLSYLTVVLVLPLYVSQQHWYIVLSGFLLMHFTMSLFLLFTFFMTHHVESTVYPTTDEKGYINTSWLMNQVKSSNDMHPFSKVANFIFGGFNNHIAHHLFPHIHHVHYPKLNKILYPVLIKNGITPNQTSYFGGIVSHLRLLKRMSRV
ncbi:fatty acid desaturase family protein [Psychroserpens luteolus]|uniref:fatty acid desaturase family protein n=1 Tax=Psychroserpens luteolus TaxID=2855840 RepID=UPI001E4C659D|nr:fatty acid desaturase [Psychroserpens luteolus]MCD2257623.1 fatty acid desaturase [Psychroserpens luteolus]